MILLLLIKPINHEKEEILRVKELFETIIYRHEKFVTHPEGKSFLFWDISLDDEINAYKKECIQSCLKLD